MAGGDKHRGSQGVYSSRNRRQLSLVHRQLIFAQSQPTFNYTGIHSIMWQTHSFLYQSLHRKEEKNISMVVWSNSILECFPAQGNNTAAGIVSLKTCCDYKAFYAGYEKMSVSFLWFFGLY